MRQVGYAMMLSKWLLLTFQVSQMEVADSAIWRIGSKSLNLRTVSKILDSMQVNSEMQKVVPLEVGRGGLLVGGPVVPMIFDLYI